MSQKGSDYLFCKSELVQIFCFAPLEMKMVSKYCVTVLLLAVGDALRQLRLEWIFSGLAFAHIFGRA